MDGNLNHGFGDWRSEPSRALPVEAAPDRSAHRSTLAFIRMMAPHAVYSHDGRLLGWRGWNGFIFATGDEAKLARGEVLPKLTAAEITERRRAAAEALVPGIRELVSRKTGRAF